MTSKTENIQPLQIKDCEILNIATGVRAQNLQELRDALVSIHADSILYHFWARKLRPSFEDPEYNNDFATWAYLKLHHNRVAERLSLLNPGRFSDIEKLRDKLIEVLDFSIRENQLQENSKENEKFQFTRSEMVIFDTEITADSPQELEDIIDQLPLGSIYFHFINSNESVTSWLSQFGDEGKRLTQQISRLDPYFFTLEDLRSRISSVFKGATN